MPRKIDKENLEKLIKVDLVKKNVTKKAMEPIKKLIKKYKNEKDKKRMIKHGLDILKGSELKAGKKRKLKRLLSDDDLLSSAGEPPKKKRKLNRGGQPKEEQKDDKPESKDAPKKFSIPILKPLSKIPNEQVRKPVEQVDKTLVNEIYSARTIADSANSTAQYALNMAQKASGDARDAKQIIERFDPEKKQRSWTELLGSIKKLSSDLENLQKQIV